MAENQLSQYQTLTPTIIFDAVANILNQNISFAEIVIIRKNYGRDRINTEYPSLINYDDEKYRKAYLYMYFTALTRAVEGCLKKFSDTFKIIPTIDSLFYQKTIINICSIGGGPGTEIFGLKLFLISENLNASIKGTILEYYMKLKCTYEDLLSKLKFNDVAVKYKKFDFRQQIDQNSVEADAIKEADLVTLVKMVSSLSYLPEREENLTKILKQMKPGAFVLFIDNNEGGYRETMHKAATAANLTFRYTNEYRKSSFISTEEKSNMDAKFGENNLRPQENLYVIVTMWIKPITKRLSTELNSSVEEKLINTTPTKKLRK